MSRIVEITLFWNEAHYFYEKVKSTLEYADALYIAESEESFSGKVRRSLQTPALIAALPKGMRDRVFCVEVDLSAMANRTHYDREIEIREAPLRYLKKNGLLAAEDFVIAQDFDEFFDSRCRVDLLKWFRRRPWRRWTHLKYQLSYYYLNYKNTFPKNHADWTLPVVFKASFALDDSRFLVDALRRNKKGPVIRANMGWHHSYLGSVAFIEDKLKAFAHASDEMILKVKKADIEQRLKSGVDLFQRELAFEVIHYESANGILALVNRKDLMLR